MHCSPHLHMMMKLLLTCCLLFQLDIDQGGRKQGIDGEPTVFVHPLGEELATRDEPPTSEGAPGSSGSDLLPGFSMQHLKSGDWLPPVRAHLAA